MFVYDIDIREPNAPTEIQKIVEHSLSFRNSIFPPLTSLKDIERVFFMFARTNVIVFAFIHHFFAEKNESHVQTSDMQIKQDSELDIRRITVKAVKMTKFN